MHELSICQSLISEIENAGQRHAFTRVTRVRLEIGRFAGVETEALRFGFEVARQNTLCAGADLEIIAMPGEGYCFTCEKTVELAGRLDPCPVCGGGRIQATGGDQLKIRDLEVV